MPLDQYVVGAVARELDARLSGGKIERIYQPAREGLLLHINVPPSDARARARETLLASAAGNAPLLYLSTAREGNPQNPPGFCMLLRKHLLNGRVSRVWQVPGERIVVIGIDAVNELGIAQKRALAIELMGKHSNIVLLSPGEDAVPDGSFDPAGAAILDAIKHVSADRSRLRQTMPGMRYALPPPAKGVSPIMEEEFALGMPKERYDGLAEAGSFEPTVYLDADGKLRDFHVFRLRVYSGMETRAFDSVSAMLEHWFEQKESGNRMQQKSADLSQVLKLRTDKLCLKKQRLLEDLQKAEDAERYRLRGELITANIYRIETGEREVLLLDYTQEPPVEVRVPLDPLLSPAQNAQKNFRRYAKAKTARVEKKKQLGIAEEEIGFLESCAVFLEHAQTDAEVDALRDELTELGYIRNRRRRASARGAKDDGFRIFRSSAGKRIYVGKNNNGNDALTMKKARPFDLWLHTRGIPGAHVLLEADGSP
ncbi:MAG: NFACT family protein, partial [Clostridiales Family XIII bacterium]|nr:NFACT family protein [Clostridiales Family XIII bacterium]